MMLTFSSYSQGFLNLGGSNFNLGGGNFNLAGVTYDIDREVEFPSDFPDIIDEGGLGRGTVLGGFGGDLALSKEENRSRVERVPVILLHGNGGHAAHRQWGMVPIYKMLKENGYNDSEIWALSYFGKKNGDGGAFDGVQMINPYRTNINDVRNFINAVIEYLGVAKVDIIGHSLGAVLGRGYILGLSEQGIWGKETLHNEQVGTLVSLSSANYGLGPFAMNEFQSGGAFEQQSHIVSDIFDDTPFGPLLENQSGQHKKETSLDNETITYVALAGRGDFVDAQHSGTGKLEGANLNMVFNLGAGIAGHQRIISDSEVFKTYLPYLNNPKDQTPVELPPIATINPGKSEFFESVEVKISANRDASEIFFSLNDGDFQKYIAPFKINETTVVEAYAVNEFGKGEIARVEFVKQATPLFEEKTSTLLEHAQSGRIPWSEFPKFLQKYGPMKVVTLYKTQGSETWTDEAPQSD